MKSMQQADSEKCPFEFNFDPATFKVGDIVSYRVDTLGEFPFVGTLLDVGENYVVISSGDPNDKDRRMKASRESRPLVPASEALDP